MAYTDIQVLESFTLRCLFPACYTPLPFSGSSSHAGKDKPVCTGYISNPGELRSLSFFLFSCCEAAHFVDCVSVHGWAPGLAYSSCVQITGGYCWPTPKCRNMCVQHAFLEGKKAEETSSRKSTPRTLKGVDQQYPGDIFIVLSVGTTGMRTGCRTPEGRRQDVAPHAPYMAIAPRAGHPKNALTSSTRTTS
jgi:hypothetical protein